MIKDYSQLKTIEKMTKVDLRTPKQREREALHQTIIGDYISLRSLFPDASNNRRMETIADKYKMTAAGVRKILVNNNVLTPSR